MGSSDMQVIFPVFMFILLVGALASFFYVSNGKEVLLSDSPGAVNIGFNDTLIADNDTHWDNNTKSFVPDGPSPVDILTGVGMAIGGGLILGLTWWTGVGGFIGAGLAIAGVGSLFVGGSRIIAGTGPGGEQFLHSLPFVGSIFDGINYVATAVVSFADMANFTLGGLIGYPFVIMLVTVPVIFMIFVFIIRFIRGQG
jgi:hypothetical protein